MNSKAGISTTTTRAFAIVAVTVGLTIFSLPKSLGKPDHRAQVTRIENVRVFHNGVVTAPQTIRILEGLILEVSPSASQANNTDIMPAGKRLDGTGLIAVPGLIDSHTHSYGQALTDALQFGVTTNMDMFTEPAELPAAIKVRASRSATNEADLFSAGMMGTAPDGHGTQFFIAIEPLERENQAAEWVSKRKAEGSDYIKLAYIPGQQSIPSISRPVAQALIQAGHDQGMQVLAHISTHRAAQDMVEDGIDGLVHVFADEPVSPELLQLMQRNNVFVIPTLSIIAAIDGKAIDIDYDQMPQLSKAQKKSLQQGLPADIKGFSLAIALGNVGLMHAAGITVLAGSDAANPGTAHGVSLHFELQLLVQAGLTPAEALSAATHLPAERFALADRGQIYPGAIADFLLVEADPTKTVSATLGIRHLIKNGYMIERRNTPTRP